MIINSLLDNDFYKFTMGNVVYQKFPTAVVRYAFTCRTPGVSFVGIERKLQQEIEHLCELRFTPEEIEYLAALNLFDPAYISFLSNLHLDSRDIHSTIEHDGNLNLWIEGPWVRTILYEVPLLAIVNELYFRNTHSPTLNDIQAPLKVKVEHIKSTPGLKLADFGTRRRFSHDVQMEVVKTLSDQLPGQFNGTSNVFMAKEFKVSPIGTQAHEYFMAHQALYRLQDFQKKALLNWAEVYNGKLGIALTDTVGMDAFLKDFTPMYAKMYDGCRHDSGDPVAWGNKLISHYNSLGIDPKSKLAVFSDALTVSKAIELYNILKDQIGVSFGIGTHLTNDVGANPINIVIKMTHCNDQPVAKISDAEGKVMCPDPMYLSYLRQCFGRRND